MTPHTERGRTHVPGTAGGQTYVPRTAGKTAERLSRRFAVVVITGPRRGGKTMLARNVFGAKPCVSLGSLEERSFAEEDPARFLARFPDGAVLDDVHRAPGLFPAMQALVDEDARPGRFILVGSNESGLMTEISQKLGSRAALLTLLPFSLGELQRAGRAPDDLDVLLYSGLFPRIHDRPVDATRWFDAYVQTYVEPEVRRYLSVRRGPRVQRFIKACAARTGQLLNLSSLASDTGISHPTARLWLGILEHASVVHLLPPHQRTFGKRIVKTPKLYFYDTGLACYLLGIHSAAQLSTHAMRPALFETWVISELLKQRCHRGQRPHLSFWRDRAGNEVDGILEAGERLIPVEMKSGQTIADDFDAALRRWRAMAGGRPSGTRVVYGGDTTVVWRGTPYVAWSELPSYDLETDRRALPDWTGSAADRSVLPYGSGRAADH